MESETIFRHQQQHRNQEEYDEEEKEVGKTFLFPSSLWMRRIKF